MEEVIGTKGLCLQEDIGTKVRKWNSFVFLLFILCLSFCASNMLFEQSYENRKPLCPETVLKHLVSKKIAALSVISVTGVIAVRDTRL